MKIDKDNIKLILILLVVALGIGYSYLNTELNINGTANINSANWNVHWNNVQVLPGSVEATTPSITDNTTVTFNVTLTKPGEYYEFTVDAVNAGTLDAMIESIDTKLNGTTITTLPDYLDFSILHDYDIPIVNDHILVKDSTETYRVLVKYKDDISASSLPSNDIELDFSLNIKYVQSGAITNDLKDNIELIDDDSSNTITTSDQICFGTECFYVMKVSDKKIKALAVNVIEYDSNNEPMLQRVSGTDRIGVAFAESYYWTLNGNMIRVCDEDHSKMTGCNVYTYINSDTSYPYIFSKDSYLWDDIVKYVSENIVSYVPSVKGRLISVEDTYELGCSINESDRADCSGAPEWLLSQDYWTGSADTYASVWIISGNLSQGSNGARYPDGAFSGLRPVIEFSTDELYKYSK